MKWVIVTLSLLLLVVQYQLWVGEGSFAEVRRLERLVAEQRALNEAQRQRNAILAAEVADLARGGEAIEERARSELGMIRRDETFFQILPEKR